MSDTLLTTKFYVPATRPEFVRRPHLVEQLNLGLHRILSLISAPAGFGKTTLVSEWLNQLTSSDDNKNQIKFAWLSLDEGDNDPGRFLTYFITAISKLSVPDTAIGSSALNLLNSQQLPPIDAIMTVLINEIVSRDIKIVFALDDYHLIEDQPIHNALNFLIENAPPQLHLVVLTREDPPFPLARLRATDQLTELRSANLRFKENETTQFLNEIMGLKLDTKSVNMLERRTEGWVAGLQMAALSIRDRENVSGFIEGFSGTNRYILDYLLEEVLERQPAEVQDFLLSASILKRFSVPLCDAVMGDSGQSAAIIEYLERANLFLVAMDHERNWYRFHHLFTDLLRTRLQKNRTNEELTILHTRAGQWHEQNGFVYEAIYHASLTKNHKWVEYLIDQNYMEIFQRKDSVSIRYWTGELRDEIIYISPRLSIHEANSRAWFGQLDDADVLLDKAENSIQDEYSSLENQALLGYLKYIRGRITAMRGDFDKAIELCLNAWQRTPTSNQALLGGIGVMLGYGYFLNGDFTHAIETLENTIQSGKKSGAINTTIGAYCVLARLYAIQGRLHEAYRLYQEAENFIKGTKEQHRGAMSIVNVGFAELFYSWNDLEAGLRHIQRGLEDLPLWSKADDIALANILFAQIQQAQGNLSSAEKSIEKASQVIRTNGVFSESRDAVQTAEFQFRLKRENSVSVGHLMNSLENRLQSKNPLRFENELPLITLARVYLSQDKFDDAKKILADLEDTAQAAGRTGRLIQIMILQALAFQHSSETTQALSKLTRCLTLAEPEGFVRVFVDEGKTMQALLTQWLSYAEAKYLHEYASHLLSQFETEPDLSTDGQEKASPVGDLIEALSTREIEVLGLIAQGKTNKKIADQLIISPGTVKAHTSSIYRKLDVTNRTEAVARARKLDLLS